MSRTAVVALGLGLAAASMALLWRSAAPELSLVSPSPDGKRWLVVEWEGRGPARIGSWGEGQGGPVPYWTIHWDVTGLWIGWDGSGENFSILACGAADPGGSHIVRLSFVDAASRGPVEDFRGADRELVESLISRFQLQKRFGLRPEDGRKVLYWFCTAQGLQEFHNAYVKGERPPPRADVRVNSRRRQQWP